MLSHSEDLEVIMRLEQEIDQKSNPLGNRIYENLYA